MKRDMELIRGLLEKLESEEDLNLPGYSMEQILYHLVLMEEADLVVAHFLKSGQGEVTGATIERLTNKGHDFLETSRNQTIWAKFKEKVTKAGGGISLDIAGDLLKEIAKNHFLGTV